MRKKKHNIIILILEIAFIFYIFYSYAVEKGYYQNRKQQEVILNEQNIKRFEKDVKEGKIIDIRDYKLNNDIDYSSKMSTLGGKAMNSLSKIVSYSSQKILKIVKTLVRKTTLK